MKQPELKVGGQWLTLVDLMSGNAAPAANEHERKAIQFCRSWHEGKAEFQFQTSGSTGSPKKVLFTRSELESSARLTEQALKLQPGYNTLICLDTDFIAGAMMLVRGLVTGMNMIVQTPSANPFNGVSDPIDFAAFVPYQIRVALLESSRHLNSLKTVIIGGAPLSDRVTDSLQSLRPSFFATYGMTETITHVALQRLNGKDRQDFFQLLPGISGTTDHRGCLVLNVPYLRSNPVTTNDLVTFIDENKFKWEGRYDKVINSGGVKVLPEKVERFAERVLKETGMEKRLFACGIPDPKLGEQVVLILEGTPLNADEELTFKKNISKHLNRFEAPKLLLYVPQFAETATQKINRADTLKKVGHRPAP